MIEWPVQDGQRQRLKLRKEHSVQILPLPGRLPGFVPDYLWKTGAYGIDHGALVGAATRSRDRLWGPHSSSPQGHEKSNRISTAAVLGLGLVVGGFVTVVRVAICWWATYRAFSSNETLSEV